METFESRLRELEQKMPAMPLRSAIRLIDSMDRSGAMSITEAVQQSLFPPDTPEAQGQWVLNNVHLTELITQGRKINAIKELRAITNLDLKRAKDAVEAAEALLDRGWLPASERAALDREAEEAIKSILNG